MAKFLVNDIVRPIMRIKGDERKWLVERISAGGVLHVVHWDGMEATRKLMAPDNAELEYRSKGPGKWAYPEQFWPSAPPRVAVAIDSGHNGYGMSMAVLDESFGSDGHPINVITQIKHHTNEVLEDPEVRLEYTTPSTENFQDKLAWYDLAIAEANEKVKKADNKSALRREQAAELRRDRDRLAVESEKASLGMPLEPAPSRYSETVITFTKKFGNAYGKSYVYAAVRAPGLSTWSVTGKSELTYATWEQVVEFILREEKSFTHRRKALQSIRLR